MKAYIFFPLAVGLSSLSLAAQQSQKNGRQLLGSGEVTENFESRISSSWRNSVNDDRDIQKQYTAMQYVGLPDSQIRFSQDYAREGTTSLQMTVPHELGKFRSEIALYPVAMGSEYWYGFSIFLPPNWQYDKQDNILAQWHADKNTKNHVPGDGTGLPPVAISVENNGWVVNIHYNSTGPSFDGPNKGSQQYQIGSVSTGKWTDFVVHAKWAATSDGFLEIWKNGEKVVDYKGAVSYLNDSAPYFKIGIYHPNWRPIRKEAFNADKSATRPIVAYYDAVKVRKAPSSYSEVAPKAKY